MLAGLRRHRRLVLAALATAAFVRAPGWAVAQEPEPEPELEPEQQAAPQPQPSQEPEQQPRKPRHFLELSAGIGVTAPLDDFNGTGEGGLGGVEYIFRPFEVVSLRLYSGVVFTHSAHDCGTGVSPCDLASRQFFMGAKTRLLAPIPYVAPYLEIGIGYSLGTATTRVGRDVDITQRGLMYHIPFGLGLAVGDRHQFELGFQFMFEPSPRQVVGGIAFGVVIPLH